MPDGFSNFENGIPAGEKITIPKLGVKTIIVAGEPGGSIPATRAKLESLWPDARIFDHHGMTEVGPVTLECPAKPGVLHVIESAYYAEVIDPASGQPATRGELVLTTLTRTGSPLLRYRTGDLVKGRMQNAEVEPRAPKCPASFLPSAFCLLTSSTHSIRWRLQLWHGLILLLVLAGAAAGAATTMMGTAGMTRLQHEREGDKKKEEAKKWWIAGGVVGAVSLGAAVAEKNPLAPKMPRHGLLICADATRKRRPSARCSSSSTSRIVPLPV